VSFAISRRSEAGANTGFFLLKLVQAAGLAFLFMIPLAMILVWPSLPNPFVVAKTWAFRHCVGGAGICAAIYGFGKRARISPVLLSFAIFVAVLGLADVFGKDPWVSFHGTPQRLEGFMTPVSALAYLGALPLLLDNQKAWRLFAGLWTVSAVIAAASGWLQVLSSIVDHTALPLIWGVDGQHVFLGIYMAFGVLFAGWSLGEAETWAGRIASAFVVAACIAVLVFSGSRIAALGLFAGLVVAIGRSPARLAAIIGTSAVFCSLNLQIVMDRLHQFPADFARRLDCWHAETVFISLRPWLGWGQDGLGVMCRDETWDRAHNLFLQALTDGGVVALIAYMGFAASIIWALTKIPLRESSIAVAAIIVYAITMMFEPESITTMVPFLTFTGWIAWRSQADMRHGWGNCK